MSSSANIDNIILILGNGPKPGLEHTLIAEKGIRLILQSLIKSFV